MTDDERPVSDDDENRKINDFLAQVEKQERICNGNLRGRLSVEVLLSLVRAVDAYRNGMPVVVRSNEGNLLHGEETLKAIIDTSVPLEGFVVKYVPQDLYEETDWPEVLEAARRVWLEDKWPKLSTGQES